MNIIDKIQFKFKYRKNISNLLVANGYDNIIIGNNTTIKSYASLQAYRTTPKGIIEFGENNLIGECLYIFAGIGKITIGNNVIAGSKLSLLGGGNISIGDDVLISHNVVITSSSHDFTNVDILFTKTKSIFRPVNISNNVFIGANVTIMMGCTINEGAMIGAGSVVTENTIIGSNEVWYGNPARMVKGRVI